MATVNDKSSDNRISQSETPVNTQYMQELNEKYFTAVKTGDMEAAQKLVDKAAERAGYNSSLLYHGTNIRFSFQSVDKKSKTEYNKRKKKVHITMNRKHNSISGRTVQVHLSVLWKHLLDLIKNYIFIRKQRTVVLR